MSPLLRLAACGVLLLAAAPALAQTAVNRSVTAQTGKSVRLVLAPSLKKDCSQGTTPEIRVITPPKNGALITRGLKLKTPVTYRCPNVETPVQAVFYQSNNKYTGADEVSFEVKNPEGTLQTYTIRITVGTSEPKKDGTEL